MSQDEEFAAQLASGGQSESDEGKAPAPQAAEAEGDTTGEQPAADAQTSPEGQADGIGEDDFIQVRVIIDDRLSELDMDLLGVRIDRGNPTDIPVKHHLVIVISRL